MEDATARLCFLSDPVLEYLGLGIELELKTAYASIAMLLTAHDRGIKLSFITEFLGSPRFWHTREVYRYQCMFSDAAALCCVSVQSPGHTLVPHRARTASSNTDRFGSRDAVGSLNRAGLTFLVYQHFTRETR